MKKLTALGMLFMLVLASCKPPAEQKSDIRVELIDGNVRSIYVYQDAISVDEFLRRVEANVTDLDRVDPSRFTSIRDGMTITIVRVTETTSCSQEELPFTTRRIPIDSLASGVEQKGQAGANGIQEVCERCIFENGNQTSCSQTSAPRIIQEPREELIYYGPANVNVPVVVEGKLAYISNGQAWLIEGNAIAKRPLTVAGQLDGRVFDLSRNGRQLLYTRLTEDPADLIFSNELWAILDTGSPEPVSLGLSNILSGQWIPTEPFTLSYSTADPETNFYTYEAYNDLWVMRIDSRTGATVDVEGIVDFNSLGLYSSWGTRYVWSPDGQDLAWSHADSVGLVDLETGEFDTLITFPHFDQAIISNWVWQPELAWSQDSSMLLTTVHGAPAGTESEINSVVFNAAVMSPSRQLVIENLISRAGIWAQPRYSPIQQDASGFPDYKIAYLQARDPLNSLGGEYDLMIADRDGSNPQRIFPPDGRPGLRPFAESQLTEFVWSPSGTHIAIIYQGNLWIVEVATRSPQQITTDGQASRPRWTS